MRRGGGGASGPLVTERLWSAWLALAAAGWLAGCGWGWVSCVCAGGTEGAIPREETSAQDPELPMWTESQRHGL